MTTISTYNLIKEGDVYNSGLQTFYVSTSGIKGLYDGNVSTSSYSIVSGGVSSLDIRFGEYFDVGCLKYYVSPIVLSDISISYGLNDVDDEMLSLVSSGTYVYADISSPVGYFRITHSGSVITDVYELSIEGLQNEEIGFGTSITGTVEATYIPGSSLGVLSSVAVPVPIFNDYPHSTDIKVAAAPTGEEEDNYIYLSTSSSGVFYGINDYGIKQPAFKELQNISNTFNISSISEVLDDWDIITTTKSYIESSTGGYLRFYISNLPYGGRMVYGWNESVVSMLVSKHSFTSNQSFTLSLDVKYVEAGMENMDRGDMALANKFMLGFTDSFPIREHFLSSSLEFPTKDRMGGSFAAVWYGAQKEEHLYEYPRTLCVGTASCDNDFNSFLSDFQEFKSHSSNGVILSYNRMEDLSEHVLMESSYSDGSLDSLWRTLKISYNHITRTVYYFMDNVFLGTFVFADASLFEHCKLFFGFSGGGSSIIYARNLVVEKDKVLSLEVKQTSASTYGSIDTLQGPNKLIDGDYDATNLISAWVSSYAPVSGFYIDVSFDSPIDVHAIRIKRPSINTNITVSGSVYKARYSMADVLFTFDTGDERIIQLTDPQDISVDGWDVKYLTTMSGTKEAVYGASSVRATVDSFFDRGSNLPVFAIDEIQFYSFNLVPITASGVEASYEYMWKNGYTRNLKVKAGTDELELNYINYYDVAIKEDCENLLQYSDYDASNPVFYSTSDTVYYRHYAETAFKRDRGGEIRIRCMVGGGSSAWFWRYFEEKISLSSIYVDMLTILEDGTYQGRVDKWKIQYLIEGGNPNVGSSWVDIPPITKVYPIVGSYATYVNYLISNNDGEYYTNFLDALDTTGAIALPSSTYYKKNGYLNSSTMQPSSSTTQGIYVEFDTSYRTQAVRFVIGGGYTTHTRYVEASGYCLYKFLCYGERATGSYISPVFDTGTKQNTERLHLSITNNGGNSTVLFRSSDVPPIYRSDTGYEVWEDVGQAFSGVDVSDGDPFHDGVGFVCVGEEIYFIGIGDSKTIIYNTVNGEWSEGPELPVESSGEQISPDTRVVNNIVLVGSTLVCASVSNRTTSAATYGVMRYYLEENSRNYLGWENLPYQRAEEALYSSMVSDGANKVFFICREGDIIVLSLDSGIMDTEGRQAIPMYGLGYRQGMGVSYYGDKIYVFGGGYGSVGIDKMDIYDISLDTWSSGPNMPYSMNSVCSIYYDGFIYVLPTSSNLGRDYSPNLKYNISTQEWTVIDSLGYNRASYFLEGSSFNFVGNIPTPDVYGLCGDYIYMYSSLRGDFRRFKVKREVWETGSLPSKDEYLWLNSGGSPWNEVLAGEELISQDRYIQYKAILEASQSGISPVLSHSIIVQPQVLENMSPGEYRNIYLKTLVSSSESTNIMKRAKIKIYND
jgi:hypothetical protein